VLLKLIRSIFYVLTLIFIPKLDAALEDYIFPHYKTPSYSNYGTLGLIQMPSARMLPAGSIALSYSDIDPYQRGSIIAYPFSWFEASYHYTDVNNAFYSDVAAFSGDQTYKDKGFDAKFLLFKESRLLPAVAIGGRDMAGTGVFSSEYIVASKTFSNIDFTAGMGWGKISSKNLKNPFTYISDRFISRDKSSNTRGGEFSIDSFFSGRPSLFGGAEIFLPNLKGLRLKIEYDSTDYDDEGFADGRSSFKYAFAPVKRPDSKLNFGFIFPYNKNLHLKLSFVKGNTLSFGFSFQGSMAKKNAFRTIKKNDPHKPTPNSELIKKINSQEDRYIYLTALKNLQENRLYLQSANIDEELLEVTYSQSHHQSYIRSTGRVLRVLDEISPDKITKFKVNNINAGMGMHSIEIPRRDFKSNMDENLFPLTERNSKISTYQHDVNNFEFQPTTIYPTSFWKIAPSVRSQIGGPDGFYFGDLRLSFFSETLFSKNLSLITKASKGLYNNFDELKLKSDSILPHVRTDIVPYLKESRNFALSRMQLNYFLNPKKDFYFKFAGGILEEMFGGIGFEALYRPFYSDFAIGAELWRVHKRDFDQRFKFRSYKTTTGYINLYYKEPRSKVIIALKGGRFLAEDSGINFDFSRRFASGLRIGAFFTLTDISKDEFGEGSFDKGFYFHIPVELFFDRYSKGLAGFGLRPITRDGGAYLIHSHHLWGVTEQAQNANLTRDWSDLYD
jgi:hypothetical protein